MTLNDLEPMSAPTTVKFLTIG